ncbi:MAG: metal ABC transporter permease [Candidatus Tectomicrobia bacterium]|nr:metal ABC transporter permease [Candidatus Tectomicrobia bacterium]
MESLWNLPFFQDALTAGVLLAIPCAILSVYVVLNRLVFLTATLGQCAVAGFGLGFLIGWQPSLVSLLLVLAVVPAFLRGGSGGTAPMDSVLGMLFVTAWASSILFIAGSAVGREEVVNAIEGNVLTISAGQRWLLAALAVGVLLLHRFASHDFLFVAFDPEMAASLGYHVLLWRLFLYGALGMSIGMTTRIGSIQLVFALLVFPAMVALRLSHDLRRIFMLAVGAAVAMSLLGVVLSFTLDVPTASTIVVLLGLLFCASLVVRRCRARL